MIGTRPALFCALWIAAPASLDAAVADPTEAEKIFALHVKPLFDEKCINCHGGDPEKKPKGEFDLRTRQSALAGGESGEPAIVPEKPAASLLVTAIKWADEDYQMPPKEADRLSPEQIAQVEAWIAAGAPWPDEARTAAIVEKFSEGITWPTSGGLSDDWTNRRYKQKDLWAYQKLARPEIPASHEGNPIDYFIDKRLAELGIEPAPPAAARTLLRRMTFDLHGLPPTPDEIDAFAQAGFRTPHSALRTLLASPRYGEQYGRHWLDVARYADSAGFANDFERPNAWRYRDYVIRSFNSDKPYDQFVREQIAGDELDPENPDAVIATGFLRMGPWEQTGMSVSKITRQQWLDDVTDTVGQTFLAHSLLCASCHDHKFDPVPTRDFYSMQAVFATAQFAERDVPWLESENRGGMDEDRAYLERRRDRNSKMLGDLSKRKKDGTLKTPDEFGRERIGRKNATRFNWELDRYRPLAMSVYNGKTLYPTNVQGRLAVPRNPMAKGVLEQTAILTGGDPFSPAEKVRPAALSAAGGGPLTDGPKGRRRELATWISDPANPLAARVIANRVWAWHFGRGLAANPNNFGATGKPPTHPQLLDFLATELTANGWSLKHLHQLIMSSATYQRSTRHPDPAALAAKDPHGESYAAFRPRRLAAEELRDAMLAVAGELNTEVGGIPARPDINLEAALQPRMIMGTFAPSYQPHPKPEQRNRRSVYAHKTRGLRDPFMEVFNQPGPDKSCERRETSTVTTQALSLINGQESYDRALAFAKRLADLKLDDTATLQRMTELALGRRATEPELAQFAQHWREMTEHHQTTPPTRQAFPTSITRQAQEENTGEPFTYTEELEIYQDYVPDLQPDEVDARTRALADLCLVIFNTNEFAYVE